MKEYIKKLIIISSVFVILVIGVACMRAYIIRSHSWKLPEKVHILFMGASHIVMGLDDSQSDDTYNWAKRSERYMFTYIKLKHILEVNHNIDTVYLEFAATDLWEDADNKYFTRNEQAGFLGLYWPYFSTEEWSIYKKCIPQTLTAIISNLLSTAELRQHTWWNQMGGYDPWDQTMDITTIHEDLSISQGFGNRINYEYLNKIINLCNTNGVKLIFIETPLIHPEYYYDQNYFHNAYINSFSEIEFLDYTAIPIHLDCFYDAHHLNKKGAISFTNLFLKDIKKYKYEEKDSIY